MHFRSHNRHLPALPGSGIDVEILERDGQKPGGDLLARCNNGVVFVNGTWFEPMPIFYRRTLLLAQQAPELSEALERARDAGFSHVILDGKLSMRSFVRQDNSKGESWEILVDNVHPLDWNKENNGIDRRIVEQIEQENGPELAIAAPAAPILSCWDEDE